MSTICAWTASICKRITDNINAFHLLLGKGFEMNIYVNDKGLSVVLHRETHPNEATTNETTALPGIPCLSSLEDEMK